MPLILITRDEAAAARDFSKPVKVGEHYYWVTNRPDFAKYGRYGIVDARRATREEYEASRAVLPVASGREDRDEPTSPVIGFMCMTAWRHEAGQTMVSVYATKDECAEYAGCTDECGIVEVEMRVRRIVKQSKGSTRGAG